jgi:hypothetical protein
MVDGRRDKEPTTMNVDTVTQGMAATHRDPRRASAVGLALVLAALVLGVCVWSASPADAHVGINTFTMVPTGTQAGGHPDVDINMEWDTSESLDGGEVPPSNPCVCDDARVVIDHFPTGFIGNPHAAPVCEVVEFSFGRCPASSQIGGAVTLGFSPLYNVAPHPDEPALTAFWVPLVASPVFISLEGRTESDYGLDAESSPIYHPLALQGTGIRLWGVPADPIHDIERFVPPLQGFASCGGFSGGEEFEECAAEGVTGAKANVPPIPFLQAPTECGVPLSGGMDLEYYTQEIVRAEYPWPSTTGCEQLTFNPSLVAHPTTPQADSPSGVDVDLKVPQELSPTTPSPSEIKATKVTLPVGFSINPSAADGKVSCSDADSAIGTRDGATCPEFSKVGTLSLDSTALPQPIPGAIYLGDPKPGDRYRLLLAADGFGTHIKLAGSIFPNEENGQLVVSFPNLPQSPLTEFDFHFFGSERGLLATPERCGSYEVKSEFTPWDNLLPPQHSLSTFTVTSGPGGSPCPGDQRPFSPRVSAGADNTTAGMHSPFTLEITRADGDQNLSSIAVKTPPGFSATLKGVPYCADAAIEATAAASYSGAAEQASPKCPAASQIGTATAGVGAGTYQAYFAGKVYLAGPYKGEPLSIAVVTPAVSGPYDLGNVVVHAAIDVDPATAQVTAFSDPLPQILDGIPLRLRFIRVDLDRPDFALNPTNCDPFSVDATIGGDEGGVASPRAGFQVANCANLPYGPKLSLRLSGGVKRRGHPAVRAVFSAKPGEANTRKVSVALPPGELLDNSHIQTICTRVQFSADACPAGSAIGTAEATTPLLGSPLLGTVYLRSSTNKLPDLVLDLEGQIDVELVGRIDTAKGGALRATFAGVPDAPVSSFVLSLAGGSKGLLVNSESLCGKAKKATVSMTGQNGAVVDSKVKLQTRCGSKNARHKRHQKRRHLRTTRAVH